MMMMMVKTIITHIFPWYIVTKMCEIIAAEIEVNQRCALRKHVYNFPCPGCSNLIVAEIEVSKPWALDQQFCKRIIP